MEHDHHDPTQPFHNPPGLSEDGEEVFIQFNEDFISIIGPEDTCKATVVAAWMTPQQAHDLAHDLLDLVQICDHYQPQNREQRRAAARMH